MTSHHNRNTRTEHPFCGDHNGEDPLGCRLMPWDPRCLSADWAAYAEVIGAFTARKMPSLAELTEKLGRIDIDALGESLARAEHLLAVPPEYQGQSGWMEMHRTFGLVVPWDIWLGTSDLDDIAAILNERGEYCWPLGSTADEPTRPKWGRLVHIHSLVEQFITMQERGQDVLNPLAPLINGYPATVNASTRTERRIIPGPLALGLPGDRRTQKGRLLPAAHIDPSSQGVLPGLRRKRLLPSLATEFWEMGGGGHGGGQTAPLSQRIFIECVTAVPFEDRAGNRRFSYTVTMREFLHWLWPERDPLPSPSEYWPKLMPALYEVDGFRLPIIDPDTGEGRARRIVGFPDICLWPSGPEQKLEVNVYLPPGSEVGPQLSDRLRYWSTLSGPAWRALLQLAFLWWIPGRTLWPRQVRNGKGKGQQGPEHPGNWLRSYKPNRYPVLTGQDLVDLCFPTTQNKSDIRKVLLRRAIKALRELEKTGDLRLVDLEGKGRKEGWQVLPPLPPAGDDAL